MSIEYDNNPPTSEPTEIERELGYRVKNGMVWSPLINDWSVPRIDHLQLAIQLIEKYKQRIAELK